MGWISVGLLYEHRFAMLINVFQNKETEMQDDCGDRIWIDMEKMQLGSSDDRRWNIGGSDGM